MNYQNAAGNMGGQMGGYAQGGMQNFGGNPMMGGGNNFGGGFNRGGMMGGMRGGMNNRGGRGGMGMMNNMGGAMPMGGNMMMGGGMMGGGMNMPMMNGMGTSNPCRVTERHANDWQEAQDLADNHSSIPASSRTSNNSKAATRISVPTGPSDHVRSRLLQVGRALCFVSRVVRSPRGRGRFCKKTKQQQRSGRVDWHSCLTRKRNASTVLRLFSISNIHLHLGIPIFENDMLAARMLPTRSCVFSPGRRSAAFISIVRNQHSLLYFYLIRHFTCPSSCTTLRSTVK